MASAYPTLIISRPNWPAKNEAQPYIIRYKDRAVTVFISEDNNLVVEIGGDFKLEKLITGNVEITLESDL